MLTTTSAPSTRRKSSSALPALAVWISTSPSSRRRASALLPERTEGKSSGTAMRGMGGSPAGAEAVLFWGQIDHDAKTPGGPAPFMGGTTHGRKAPGPPARQRRARAALHRQARAPPPGLRLHHDGRYPNPRGQGPAQDRPPRPAAPSPGSPPSTSPSPPPRATPSP